MLHSRTKRPIYSTAGKNSANYFKKSDERIKSTGLLIPIIVLEIEYNRWNIYYDQQF